jgi:hypothetical protein
VSGFQTLVGEGAVTRDLLNALNNNFAAVQGFPGNKIYCDAANGSDNGSGAIDSPLRTLLAAYNQARDGKNDVIVLIGDGTTAATQRVNSSFTWAKNAVHLVGVSSGVNISNRSRISPSSGVAAFTPYMLISGSGCLFANIQWFMAFSTGTTNQIGLNVTGSRNLFIDCHIAGLADAASAADAGSRTLKIGSGGSGENMFVRCTIGVDTVTRSAANASVELAGATARNQFIECLFPVMTSSAAALVFLGTGNGCVDRFTYLRACAIINAVKSTSTTLTVAFSFSTNAPGGMIVLDQCTVVGATDWGDANFFSNAFVNMSAPSAAAGGLAVVPS